MPTDNPSDLVSKNRDTEIRVTNEQIRVKKERWKQLKFKSIPLKEISSIDLTSKGNIAWLLVAIIPLAIIFITEGEFVLPGIISSILLIVIYFWTFQRTIIFASASDKIQFKVDFENDKAIDFIKAVENRITRYG